MQLRKTVRENLSVLPIEQIQWLATKMLEEFPEQAHRLAIVGQDAAPPPPPPPEFEIPAEINESTLWPLIEKRQAHVALRGAPREALDSALFFARVYGKIASEKRAPASRKEPPPEKSEAELLADTVKLAEENFPHEPGEAIAVDAGLSKR